MMSEPSRDDVTGVDKKSQLTFFSCNFAGTNVTITNQIVLYAHVIPPLNETSTPKIAQQHHNKNGV